MASLNGVLFSRHLEDDESVTIVVHKHWLLGIKYLFTPILSFALSLAFYYYFPFQTIALISAAWAIASLVWMLRNFFDYYLDAWIITDQGVIDIVWHGWFHRASTRVLYSDIQGVSYEIQGVAATLLRFGQISVEKISTGSAISMEYVSNPRRVEGIILKNMEAYLHTKNLKDAKHVQGILSEIVAREMQMAELNDDDE